MFFRRRRRCRRGILDLTKELSIISCYGGIPWRALGCYLFRSIFDFDESRPPPSPAFRHFQAELRLSRREVRRIRNAGGHKQLLGVEFLKFHSTDKGP